MTVPTYDSVLQQALLLSWDDREKLSEEIWKSLHPPNPLSDEEIAAIVAQRIREIDEGRAVLISSEQARKEIFDEE